MNEKPVCPQCGRQLPSYAPQGVCPACVARANLETGTGWGTGSDARPPPMTVEEVARLFPEMEILDLLGSGGMGAVYKARQPKLERLVALKILNRHDGDSRFVERFTREAQTLARLNHPNIVAVHEFGERDGFFFLIMELVDGVSLRHLLQKERMTPEQALGIVPPICEALEYAHDKGVVHRDIKPENILMDKEGRVKVADFGIARLAGADRGKPITGDADVMGTAHYMAPEQVERPAEVDHRADIYALGVVFYEMLTGELPLGLFPHPSKRVQVDVRLDEVVLKALEKEPNLRYQHASDVKTGVETFTSWAMQEKAAGDKGRSAGAAPARPWLLPIVAGLFLMAALGGVMLLWMMNASPVSLADTEETDGTAAAESDDAESEAQPSREERLADSDSAAEAAPIAVPEAPGLRAGVEIAQVPPMKPSVEIPMGTFPQGVTLADLDGDGRLDAITANREDHSITIRPGNGDGTFGEPATYGTNPDPVYVRAADLTGNGIPDLISANHSNSVTVLLGRGDGTFGEPVSYSTGEGELTTLSVAVADFTGNGIPDLATANFTGDSVSLLPGLGEGVFDDPIQIPVGRGPISITTADFNGSGHPDLATANRGDNSATILLGDGSGGFVRTDTPIGERAGFVVAGDLTNNGAVDLAIPNFSDGSISLLLGDGEGRFTRRDIGLGRCHPSSLALGDMNNDGRLDIVAVCQGMRSLLVFLNGGGARFTSAPRIYSVGASPDAVAVGDLNGDGLTDMVSANLRGHSISVVVTDNRPNLTGVVRDNAGQPLSDARVFIHTAEPKSGPDSRGPFGHPDCAKRARTAANGRFTLARLNPELRFQIAVAAPGHQAQLLDDVDPADGPLEIILPPAFPGETSDRRIRGRVLAPDGEPVSGAALRIRGITRDGGRSWGGYYSGFDNLAVSDDDGSFVINAIEPFDAAGLVVEAGGLAPRLFPNLPAGDTVHELRLTAGVTVTGRVVRDGEPVPGVTLGLQGTSQGMDHYAGDFSVATGPEGRFRFAHVPAGFDYHLSGDIGSLGPRESLPSRPVATGEDGSVLDVGDLAVEAGYHLEGRIRLTDGSPVAEGTHVSLSRSRARDTVQTETDAGGRFRFTGVSPESVRLSVKISGYALTARNASIDPLNPFWMIGRIREDKTDLLVELEPGDRHDRLAGEQYVLRELPLRGAEEVTAAAIRVTGTVVDGETGEPVSAFTVTEGRQSRGSAGRIGWFNDTRRTRHTEGRFTVLLDDHPDYPPALLIESDGYLPHATGTIAADGAEIAVTLEKGAGYEGVLLAPDGRPAGGVTLYLLDQDSHVYVRGTEPDIHTGVYGGHDETRSDDSGRFSFAPQVDPYGVVAFGEAGYAEITIEDLARDPEVRLRAWARVEGTLKIGDAPGAGESVRLYSSYPPYTHHPRSSPVLQFLRTATTDSEGRFVFERVPPIPVSVFHHLNLHFAGPGPIIRSQAAGILPEPGEAREITLGGRGRPVTGRVSVEGFDGEVDWSAGTHTLRPVVPPPPGLPDFAELQREGKTALEEATTEEEKEAVRAEFEERREEAIGRTRAFYATPEGMAHHLARLRTYALDFSSGDGRFRAQDIPGGRHTLRVDLRERRGSRDFTATPRRVTIQTTEVEIPDSPGGYSKEPFDLGAIEMEVPGSVPES